MSKIPHPLARQLAHVVPLVPTKRDKLESIFDPIIRGWLSMRVEELRNTRAVDGQLPYGYDVQLVERAIGVHDQEPTSLEQAIREHLARQPETAELASFNGFIERCASELATIAREFKV